MIFTQSLKKNKEFLEVYQKGDSFANKYLVMYVLKNNTIKNRLGISISKKVGNSVKRNRLRRLIKENYRLSEEKYQKGLDIVVVARISSRDIGYKEVGSALLHLKKLHKV